MKVILFFTLFNLDSFASSSYLILRAQVLPKYTVIPNLKGNITFNSNTINNDSVKVQIEKKGKLFNCYIIQK